MGFLSNQAKQKRYRCNEVTARKCDQREIGNENQNEKWRIQITKSTSRKQLTEREKIQMHNTRINRWWKKLQQQQQPNDRKPKWHRKFAA